MKKYLMTIQFVIQAEGRTKAWDTTEDIIKKHLRDLGNVVSAHELPDQEARESIAVNEPIKSSLKVHAMVMIYQDPITEQKPEGKACLLHKIEDLPDGLERWKVCFEGDNGEVYERTIKVN